MYVPQKAEKGEKQREGRKEIATFSKILMAQQNAEYNFLSSLQGVGKKGYLWVNIVINSILVNVAVVSFQV